MVMERTYRGVSADERRAQRHRRLLDATLELWGRPDLPRLTMTGVCQEAGLTERYFYESFDHLDDAQREVLDEVLDAVDDRTVAALGGVTEPAARFRVVAESFIGVLTDDPRRGRVALVEAAAHDATRERRDVLLRRLARLAAREARKLHGPDTWGSGEGVLVATMFVGGVVQLVSGWLDGSLTATPSQLVDATERVFHATARL